MDFLKRVALARDVHAWRRIVAVNLAWPGSSKWFEWPAFLKSDDPLAYLILLEPNPKPSVWSLFYSRFFAWVKTLPLEERKTLCEATLKNSNPWIRQSGVRILIFEEKEKHPFFLKMFEDSDVNVQMVAYRYFMKDLTVHLAPMLIQILQEQKFVRLRKLYILEIINTLVKIAEPESLEPLGALLDDPDLTIRAQALRGLREIRKALEEKQEWKRVIQEMKRGHEKK